MDARTKAPLPTGRERTFGEEEIIVSKTDARGRITYANEVFERVSGYAPSDYLGAPHSFVRHPDMPACVFQMLWDTIQSGREFFGYVVNLAKNGDHYWVFAHVTPTFDADGSIAGFHSNRRSPDREAVRRIERVYASLRAEERKHSDRREAIRASTALLSTTLSNARKSYEEFAFSLQETAA